MALSKVTTYLTHLGTDEIMERRDRANLWRLISRCAYNRSDPVKRINSSFFLELGGYLNHLKGLAENSPWTDNNIAFLLTEMMLRDLIEEHEPVEITYSLGDAKSLRSFLIRAIDARKKDAPQKKDKIDYHERIEGHYLVETFEKSLVTELRETNTYFVSPVGIFSTSALLTKAEEMFGEHRNLLPKVTVIQIKEAGKCLAFSLGSAVAFHLFGALESVLREYYDKLSGGKPRPKNPSMGAYIGELADMPDVDQKLIAALRQVKDLHRNPAIHFERTLTMGEALTLVGMIHSAISTTLDIVAKLPPQITAVQKAS
jgi:hypothetical protein